MENMFECFTSSHSVYFEGPFDMGFWKKYKGVVVNASSDELGHFAIRKPYTSWFKLPKFIQKIFPYKWVMLKNKREKLHYIFFNDVENMIIVVADRHNPSPGVMKFDKETYLDLKTNVPVFLEKVGYKFEKFDFEDYTKLVF